MASEDKTTVTWQFRMPVTAFENWQTNGYLRIVGSERAILRFAEELDDWSSNLRQLTRGVVLTGGVHCQWRFGSEVTLDLVPDRKLFLWAKFHDVGSIEAFAGELSEFARFIRSIYGDKGLASP